MLLKWPLATVHTVQLFDVTQYGSFLIPVIMQKLPAEVRLQIACGSAKDVWEEEELLAVIKTKVEARYVDK